MGFGLRRGIISSGVLGGIPTHAASTANLDGTMSLSATDAASLKPTNITALLWVKTTLSGTSFVGLMDKFSPGLGGGYALDFPSGANMYPRFFFEDSGTRSVIGSTSLNDGVWHLIGATYDGTNIKLYVDDALEATTAHSGAIDHSTQDLFIGGDGASSNRLVGSMGFSGIWSTDLSLAQFQNIYHAGVAVCYDDLENVSSGITTNLESYWHMAEFDSHTTDELTDQHGANDLTNNGTTPFDGTGLTVACT